MSSRAGSNDQCRLRDGADAWGIGPWIDWLRSEAGNDAGFLRACRGRVVIDRIELS